MKRSFSLDLDLNAEPNEPSKMMQTKKSRRKAAKNAKNCKTADQIVGGPSGLTSVTQSCSDDLSQDSMCIRQSAGDVEETTLSQQSTGSETDLKNIVETQQREIEKLNTVINSLSTKVSFLLTFLGIEEQASSNGSSAAIAAGVTHLGINKSTTSASSSQLLSSSVVNNSNIATPSFADQVKNTPVYQAVVSTVCSELSASTAKNFQRSIVSAVHTDLQEKQKRSSNIVVAGLKTTEYDDEKAVVAGMIWSEFGKQVTVKFCKRLGKQATDRTQNLLVTLSSADDAAFLIQNARMLRQSTNSLVRSSIYINADLTPAEALAAYEARCARRQRRATIQAKRAQSGTAEWMVTGESTSHLRSNLTVAAAATASTAPAGTSAITTTEMTTSTIVPPSQFDPMTLPFTPQVVSAEQRNSAE